MMAASVRRWVLASIAQPRLRDSLVAGLDTLTPDRRWGQLTGVLPKSFARQKVGRAVLSAPRASEDARNVRVLPIFRDALGTARPTADLFGQHALTPAAGEPLNIVFSFTRK